MFEVEDLYKAGYVLGGLSILIFFLGHLGHVSPVYLAIASIAAAVIFTVSILRRRSVGEGPDCVSRRLSPLALTLISVTILLVAVLVPLALTPPAVRDELIQHLAVPRLYLAKGRIYEIPFMGFSYLPQNIDLLYMIPLAFGSDIAPRLMHMGFAILTGLLVYFFLLPGSGRVYALLGLFLYLATPLVANLSRMAYIDNGSAFFSTLALFAALRWRSDGFRLRWLVYAALSMGFALGSKYNASISYLLIALFIFYAYSKDRKDLFGAINSVFIFLTIAIVVFSPWLARNYVWKGNPFYPLWGTAMHAVSKGEGFNITGGISPMVKRLTLYKENTLDLLLLPLRIFWGGVDNSIRGFDGVMNPLYLAFIPLAFLKRRPGDVNTKFLAVFSFLFLLFAAFTVDLVTRYLMPVVPLVVILVVLGFRNLLNTRRLATAAAVVLMAALLVFDATYLAGLYKRYAPMAYLTGGGTREQYLEKTLPDYAAVSYANRTLPKDALVILMFVGERGYYWERDYYYGDRNGVYFYRFVRASSSGAELLGKFIGTGATHLFMHEALVEKFINDNFTNHDLKVVADFFNNHTKRLFHANGFALYALEQPPRPGL